MMQCMYHNIEFGENAAATKQIKSLLIDISLYGFKKDFNENLYYVRLIR